MIILLNGPPRCGKDTAAGFLMKNLHNCAHYKMSSPLKRAVPALYNLSDDIMKVLEDQKDHVTPFLFGHTYRDVQIAISECLLKPLHCEHIFGRIAVLAMRQMDAGNIVVSDTGFDDEVLPILDEFGPGNVGLIQITRKDHTFENDSRDWIDPGPFRHHADVFNYGTLEDYEKEIMGVMRKWHLLKDK